MNPFSAYYCTVNVKSTSCLFALNQFPSDWLMPHTHDNGSISLTLQQQPLEQHIRNAHLISFLHYGGLFGSIIAFSCNICIIHRQSRKMCNWITTSRLFQSFFLFHHLRWISKHTWMATSSSTSAIPGTHHHFRWMLQSKKPAKMVQVDEWGGYECSREDRVNISCAKLNV